MSRIAVKYDPAGRAVVPLGVLVRFHPGVPEWLRPWVLDVALRELETSAGWAVMRGAKPAFIGKRSVWLSGWTIAKDGQREARRLSLAYRADDAAEGGEEDGEGTERVSRGGRAGTQSS